MGQIILLFIVLIIALLVTKKWEEIRENKTKNISTDNYELLKLKDEIDDLKEKYYKLEKDLEILKNKF